ncbi:MAG: hypothetical protein ACRDTX_17200 [Pseudonocardiaceae bacterium]
MTQVMISSCSRMFAEREILANEMARAFDDVVRVPEEARAGTPQNMYLRDARNSTMIIALLGQESRPAVQAEIEAGLEQGAHVAAFSLRYPPHVNVGDPWVATVEESHLRSQGHFVKDVSGIVQLIEEVWRAIAYFIANTQNRLRLLSADLAYPTFLEWFNNIEYRICSMQRTSTVVLGARRAKPDEAACLRGLDRALLVTPGNRTMLRFFHFFDEEATALEVATRGDEYDLTSAQQRIRNYCKIVGSGSRRSPRVWLIPRRKDDEEISPALIVDNHVAVSTDLGKGGASFAVARESAPEADKIYDALLHNVPAKYDPVEVERSLRVVYGDPSFRLI